ncbi:MAG: hypothetical protein HDS26_05375 [Bacteroides sp.]|nr:hypothetical protein [Bacteroides sp.]
MNKENRPPLPDCSDCSGCGSGGSCASGGCAGNGCSSGGCSAAARFNGDREPRGKIFATNWLDNISTSADYPAVQVQFKNTRNAFFSNPSKLNLEIGDIVAVEAAPGHDIGRVSMVGPLVRMQMLKNRIDPESELRKVFRIATESDMERFEEARAREHQTMIRSRVIAEELGLNMKIGDVEFQGDGSKAIFYYIADERVDFRKLIRLLADEFHVRIEMKQIGARQEAGRIGGIGPCGRPLCCSSWMTHFVSVGTGAARMQDLSMNPQKLAGQCAKLKCCLNFEIDAYAESSKKLPPKDVVLETKDCDYYFAKADILQRMITYSTDRKVLANLVTIPASRAFEIIALNKQGVKVDSLAEMTEKEEEPREYIDLTDQDSLTRFDRSRQHKKRRAKTEARPEVKPAEPKKGESRKGENKKSETKKGETKKGRPEQKKVEPKKGESRKPSAQTKSQTARPRTQQSQNGQPRQPRTPRQEGARNNGKNQDNNRGDGNHHRQEGGEGQ